MRTRSQRPAWVTIAAWHRRVRGGAGAPAALCECPHGSSRSPWACRRCPRGKGGRRKLPERSPATVRRRGTTNRRAIRMCAGRGPPATAPIHEEEDLMSKQERTTHRLRLRPLAAGLALALAVIGPTTAASPAGRDVPQPFSTLARHDLSLMEGWQPPERPTGDALDALVQAWMQRPRIERPSTLPPDTTRGGVTHVVTHCDDAGPGSFRDAFSLANPNDTVDLSCSPAARSRSPVDWCTRSTTTSA